MSDQFYKTVGLDTLQTVWHNALYQPFNDFIALNLRTHIDTNRTCATHTRHLHNTTMDVDSDNVATPLVLGQDSIDALIYIRNNCSSAAYVVKLLCPLLDKLATADHTTALHLMQIKTNAEPVARDPMVAIDLVQKKTSRRPERVTASVRRSMTWPS